MPKYLQVSRYLVQDFSVVDFWTVVLESTTQPFFLGAATQRWRTRRRVMAHILKKKKTVTWETTISVDKKRAVLKLKFQVVQSEYKVWFFFKINCLCFWKFSKYVLQVKQMGSFKRVKLVKCKYKLKSF